MGRNENIVVHWPCNTWFQNDKYLFQVHILLVLQLNSQ